MLALAYCHHDLKLLHRDLKPQNVFLKDDLSVNGIDASQVKVGDFGISKMLAMSQGLAATQCGTPLYMAPEMCRGEMYTRSADIWGLGCILYELMTLQQPWLQQLGVPTGIDGLMRYIARDRLCVDLRALRDHYSPELCAVLKALTAADSMSRPSLRSILTWPVLQEEASEPSVVVHPEPAPDTEGILRMEEAADQITRSFRSKVKARAKAAAQARAGEARGRTPSVHEHVVRREPGKRAAPQLYDSLQAPPQHRRKPPSAAAADAAAIKISDSFRRRQARQKAFVDAKVREAAALYRAAKARSEQAEAQIARAQQDIVRRAAYVARPPSPRRDMPAPMPKPILPRLVPSPPSPRYPSRPASPRPSSSRPPSPSAVLHGAKPLGAEAAPASRNLSPRGASPTPQAAHARGVYRPMSGGAKEPDAPRPSSRSPARLFHRVPLELAASKIQDGFRKSLERKKARPPLAGARKVSNLALSPAPRDAGRPYGAPSPDPQRRWR